MAGKSLQVSLSKLMKTFYKRHFWCSQNNHSYFLAGRAFTNSIYCPSAAGCRSEEEGPHSPTLVLACREHSFCSSPEMDLGLSWGKVKGLFCKRLPAPDIWLSVVCAAAMLRSVSTNPSTLRKGEHSDGKAGSSMTLSSHQINLEPSRVFV